MKTTNFNIEKVLDGAKVVTRDGRAATYIGVTYIDSIHDMYYPFIFEIDGTRFSFTKEGKLSDNRDNLDLFLED